MTHTLENADLMWYVNSKLVWANLLLVVTKSEWTNLLVVVDGH